MPNQQLMIFHALHRAHQNAVNSELGARDLRDLGHPMLMVILKCWEDQGHIPQQRELAEALRVSPAAVANSMKNLARLELIHREEDENDARSKRICLTDKGRETVARCQECFDKVDEAIFQGFSAEEMAAVKGYHLRILRNLYAVGGRDPADRCMENPFVIPEERKFAHD